MKWLRRCAIGIFAICVLLVGSIFAVQELADGPVAFLQGGPFSTGSRSTDEVRDWESVLGGPRGSVELELAGFESSRTTGFLLYAGELYIPCDLGFMWGRLEGGTRWLLRAIYTFKRWHEDALVDGRAVLRVEGRLIGGRLLRVTEPGAIEALRDLLNARYTDELGPPPTEGPRDIWFFRFLPGAL